MSSIGPVRCWAIITGEYPPDPGGVADHSRQLAEGLTRRGCEVAVFVPGRPDAMVSGPVHVTRLPRGLGMRGMASLGRALETLPVPKRILVQYVPHSLGMESMNLPFCAWLRSRPEPLDVLFHEVASPWGLRRSWRDNMLGAAHRVMARLAGDRAERVFVSCGTWVALLRRLGIRKPIVVLPVPSNLPTEADATRVRAVRARLNRVSDGHLVGHFGTFRAPVAEMLTVALGELLARVPDCRAVLVGRGSLEYCADLCARRPDLVGRLLASGALPPADAAAHLSACDVLLQPYPDGATTRRGSLMAGLALGVPIVATRGALTEPWWAATGGLALAATAPEMAQLAATLLAEPERLGALGAQGATLYRDRFQLSHTIEGLLGISG